jgi:hypothetical protein
MRPWVQTPVSPWPPKKHAKQKKPDTRDQLHRGRLFIWIFKTSKLGAKWLMPVILTTWEAQIRRIVVPGQLKKRPHLHQLLGKCCVPLIPNYLRVWDWKDHCSRPHPNRKGAGPGGWACHPRDIQKPKIVGLWSRLAWAKSDTPISKITRAPAQQVQSPEFKPQ